MVEQLKAPKCPLDIDRGIIAQTYRVAGSNLYKCFTCGRSFEKDMFKAIDYRWHSNPKGWFEEKKFEPKAKVEDGPIKTKRTARIAKKKGKS